MRAGKLDRRLTIERLVEGALNAFNEPAETWSPIAQIWASRKDILDVEKTSAGLDMSALSARFVVRSTPDTMQINTDDRIVGEGGNWNISGIKELGRSDWIEITAMRRSD